MRSGANPLALFVKIQVARANRQIDESLSDASYHARPACDNHTRKNRIATDNVHDFTFCALLETPAFLELALDFYHYFAIHLAVHVFFREYV